MQGGEEAQKADSPRGQGVAGVGWWWWWCAPCEGKHLSLVQAVGMEKRSSFGMSTVIHKVSISAQPLGGGGAGSGDEGGRLGAKEQSKAKPG